MDSNGIYSATGCLLNCNKNEYKPTKVFTSTLQGVGLTLIYTFPTGTYTENTEYVLYDYNTFIADIGGYLGLLVGQSILGVYKRLASMKRPTILRV